MAGRRGSLNFSEDPGETAFEGAADGVAVSCRSE